MVIIQDDRFNATASVTVFPLTTNLLEAPLTRIEVEPTVSTEIEQPRRWWTNLAIPRGNVRGQLGRITDADVIRLNSALVVFLGLAD